MVIDWPGVFTIDSAGVVLLVATGAFLFILGFLLGET